MKSKILVVDAPKGKLHIDDRDISEQLSSNDVLIKVQFCGVCHTDIHEIDNDWGQPESFYPFVPGHEVIGEIVRVGSVVEKVKIGDIVGVGWQNDSCGTCYACKRGWRNACEAIAATYGGQNGGFQQYIVSNEAFAIPIPVSLQKPETAPLLCGGITVYNPLLVHDVQPSDNTLVIGLGGLGHLAVQFLAKRGNQVSVLTRSADKHDDATQLGASAFYTSLEEVPKRSFEFIIVTAPGSINLSDVIKKATPRGKVCIVGAVPGELSFSAFDLIDGEVTLCSGSIGDPVNIAGMLEFAAKHDIQAIAEVSPAKDVDDALLRLREGKTRYRAVLDMREL